MQPLELTSVLDVLATFWNLRRLSLFVDHALMGDEVIDTFGRYDKAYQQNPFEAKMHNFARNVLEVPISKKKRASFESLGLHMKGYERILGMQDVQDEEDMRHRFLFWRLRLQVQWGTTRGRETVQALSIYQLRRICEV